MRDLSLLNEQNFDVVVIGGGITGAWISLHCAQQGLKTALIEQSDYASQTSSASSKLLHGGIRYLQQMQFNKVRESAMERAEYIYAAPHLSRSVPFVVPTYKDFKRSKFFLNCGMLAYQALCIGENSKIESAEQVISGTKSISAGELNDICKINNDEPHTGGVIFKERHMHDSERMVLAIIQTAQELGAVTYNHVSAIDFLGSEQAIKGVKAHDLLSDDQFNIHSKLVINAAGPWVDTVNRHLKSATRTRNVNAYAVGSHIITKQISDHAIAIATQYQSESTLDRGGRHVFIIPWRGHSLIGTSYTEIDSPDADRGIDSEHIDQLLNAVNEGMPSAKLTRKNIVSGYSGFYLLHTQEIKNSVYQGSGEYHIIDHKSTDNVDGLITSIGAKFTTGRKLSALTMNIVGKKLNVTPQIQKTKFIGSDYQNFNELRETCINQYCETYTENTIDHLLICYGSNIHRFLEHIKNKPTLKKTICSTQPDLIGQITWAIEYEQAYTLNDVIFGRTSLGLLGIHPRELSNVASLMAEQLAWSDKELDHNLAACSARLDRIQIAISG